MINFNYFMNFHNNLLIMLIMRWDLINPLKLLVHLIGPLIIILSKLLVVL